MLLKAAVSRGSAMLKKLQRKYLLITMCSAFAVVALIMAAINFAYVYQTRSDVHAMLNTLADNNGRFPEMDYEKKFDGVFDTGGFSKETPYKTRYFFVQADDAGNVRYIHLDNIAAISTQDAITLAYNALNKGSEYGTQGIYKYIVSEKYYGKMIVFVDCSEQKQVSSFLLFSTLIIIAVVLMMLFIPVYFLTKRATRPVAESFEKQKQFITDASHEIKTPLAIISANADVLELSGEDNEWVQSIQHQTQRLDKLVKNLVALSKMDETKPSLVFQSFSISDAVIDTAAPFETLAESKNKSFEMNVQPELIYNGDEASIRQLVSILCDNAIKYSNDGGAVRVSLYKKNKQTVLEMYNTCESIDVSKLDKLFDRFYRADESRSRQTGGFGIGLSIAKATVQAHKGKIEAKSADGKSVTFVVTL